MIIKFSFEIKYEKVSEICFVCEFKLLVVSMCDLVLT